jgi:hypothetical protein
MRILMLSSAFAVLSFGAVGMSAQSAAPPAPIVSRIHQLEIEDQSENPGNISAAEYYKHGDTRRAEIRKLLADGKALSAHAS